MRPKAVEVNPAGADHASPALVDRPDMRLIKLGYRVPLLLLTAGVSGYLVSIDGGSKFALGYVTVIVTVSTLLFFLSYHARLRRAIYTVTPEYIEAQTGTFEKTVRRIRLSHVRAVTHSQNLFQTLFDTSDIMVAATNGDRIVLENVTEGERKREILWELVLAKSPNAPRSVNVNQ